MKIRFVLQLGATAAAVALTLPAWAQSESAANYPSRPIRIIVPYTPGAINDVLARRIAQHLSEALKQSVVVENKPGGGTVIGTEYVARAAPDGYTMLLVSGQNAFSPYLFKSLPYDPVDSFSMISTIGTFHFVLVVDKDSPLKTVNDVVAAARRDPAHFNIGTISVGSAQHLSARLFATMAGIDVPIVPFKSTGDVIAALRGRSVQVGMETVTGAMNQIRGGALRAIATSGSSRISFLPDVPTIAESGGPALAKYESDSWNGIVAPAGTPPAIVQKLNQEIAKALQAPDVRQRFLSLGIEPRSSTPQELKEVFRKDAAKWRVVIEEAGIEKQ